MTSGITAFNYLYQRCYLPVAIPSSGLRRLGANLTCDPNFATTNLFIS